MQTKTGPTIDPETANHILWHFGRGGYQPGSFTEQLITTIAMADPTNQALLGLGFPELVVAVQLAQNVRGGVDQLQRIARREPALRCARCQQEDGPFTAAGLCEACARPMPLAGLQ